MSPVRFSNSNNIHKKKQRLNSIFNMMAIYELFSVFSFKGTKRYSLRLMLHLKCEPFQGLLSASLLKHLYFDRWYSSTDIVSLHNQPRFISFLSQSLPNIFFFNSVLCPVFHYFSSLQALSKGIINLPLVCPSFCCSWSVHLTIFLLLRV
jgi:hypothetical protein